MDNFADIKHNRLDATVFVYEDYETGEIHASYIDGAKRFDSDKGFIHLATLEPRAWIEHNYKRKQVDLTDDEIKAIALPMIPDEECASEEQANFLAIAVIRAVIAADRRKNK